MNRSENRELDVALRVNLVALLVRHGGGRGCPVRARLDRVAVIREVDGDKRIFFHDIRNSNILQSPCFFLQQNDIIYVQPKYGKKDREDRGIQIGTLLLSAVTSISSVIWATSSIVNSGK